MVDSTELDGTAKAVLLNLKTFRKMTTLTKLYNHLHLLKVQRKNAIWCIAHTLQPTPTQKELQHNKLAAIQAAISGTEYAIHVYESQQITTQAALNIIGVPFSVSADQNIHILPSKIDKHGR